MGAVAWAVDDPVVVAMHPPSYFSPNPKHFMELTYIYLHVTFG